MSRRHAAAAFAVTVVAVLGTALPALAAGPAHTAVIDGRAPNDPAFGRARLQLDEGTGMWDSSVRMQRLLPGLYEYAVQVGVDSDGNGFPDTFSFHTVCRFVANAGGSGGCSGTTALGGRTSITPWTTAEIVDRRTPATFSTASGLFS